MRIFAMMILTLFTASAFAVGTVTATKTSVSFDGGKKTRIVQVDFVGSASDGTVPATAIAGMHGYLMKMVTDPGSTAPTDNYDITLVSADGDDALISQGLNRDTATTEAIYPVTAAGQLPVYLPGGSYTFTLTNNSVNSATGRVKMYFVDSL